MRSTMHVECEIAADAATLYLSGSLGADDGLALNRLCGQLPARVSTLRLDLHGISPVTDDGMLAIRGVLRFWREARGGSFRLALTSEHLVATYTEGSIHYPERSMRSAPAHIVEASASHTAMYL